MKKEELYFSVMTLPEIETLAAQKGCSTIVAQPNQLQFDLDTGDVYSHCKDRFIPRLENRFKQVLPVEEWRSKSAHWHVVVTLPIELEVTERIALQSQGGSDYGREFAALCCHWDGSPHPILLFKPLVEVTA